MFIFARAQMSTIMIQLLLHCMCSQNIFMIMNLKISHYGNNKASLTYYFISSFSQLYSSSIIFYICFFIIFETMVIYITLQNYYRWVKCKMSSLYDLSIHSSIHASIYSNNPFIHLSIHPFIHSFQ